MPEKRWKRPALLVLTPPFIFSYPFMVYVEQPPVSLFEFTLIGFLTLMGLAGFVIGVFGCDACVARYWGKV